MESLSSTAGTEQQIPAPVGSVFWNARQDASKANAWGGYFRIVPPHDVSAIYEFDVCAGCGQVRPAHTRCCIHGLPAVDPTT